MKRMIFALMVVACCCSPSPAMWAMIPLDQLVQDCDLIVVGTLKTFLSIRATESTTEKEAS